MAKFEISQQELNDWKALIDFLESTSRKASYVFPDQLQYLAGLSSTHRREVRLIFWSRGWGWRLYANARERWDELAANHVMDEGQRLSREFYQAVESYRKARGAAKIKEAMSRVTYTHAACLSHELIGCITHISDRYTACGLFLPAEAEVEENVRDMHERQLRYEQST